MSEKSQWLLGRLPLARLPARALRPPFDCFRTRAPSNRAVFFIMAMIPPNCIKLHAGDEANECRSCLLDHSLYHHQPLSLYQQTMATCVSLESNPFTIVPSFTLKPRAERCLDDNFKDRLLAPSIGRGLRIQSSFEIEDAQTRARSLTEPQASAPSVTVEPPSWAVRASGEARLEVSRFVYWC